MAPFGLNQTTRTGVGLALPFRGDDEVRGNLLQLTQEVGKGASGRLLERQDLDIVVIDTEMIAMTLQRGIAGLEIDVTGVFQATGVAFERVVVQEPPKKPEGLLPVENRQR